MKKICQFGINSEIFTVTFRDPNFRRSTIMDKMGYDQMLKYRGVTVDGKSPGYGGEQKPRPSIPPNHKIDSNSLKPCQSQVQIKSSNYTYHPQSKSIHHFVEDKTANISKTQFQPIQSSQMQFSKTQNGFQQFQPQMQQPIIFPPQQMQQPIILQPNDQMMMQPQMMTQQQPMVIQPPQMQSQMMQPQQMPQQSYFMPQPQQIQPPMDTSHIQQNVPTFILPSQNMLKQQMQMMPPSNNQMQYWNM